MNDFTARLNEVLLLRVCTSDSKEFQAVIALGKNV